MGPAVSVVLDRGTFPGLTARDELGDAGFCGFKSSRRTAPQAEGGPHSGSRFGGRRRRTPAKTITE